MSRWERYVDRLYDLYWIIRYSIGGWICKRRGCRLQGTSSVGPDHGSEDLWCDRCGYSDHIIYY